MPATYTLISSNVLTSSAASVTFSAIPATYTDLVVKISSRSDAAAIGNNIELQFNGDTATNYSTTTVGGNGATASSQNSSSNDHTAQFNGNTGANATATTFSNTEVYIPSYTVSQNKPIGGISASENNATTGFNAANAGLWRNTAAITSILINTSGNFVSGSSFYLYGISNA
jgi:hypothetical protein